jgi:hypothetical protein
MELLQALPDLTRDELLYIADRENVPLESRVSEAIIAADIQREIARRNPLLPRFDPPFIRESLVRALIVESGIDPVTFPSAEKFLRSHGVPIELLHQDNIPGVVATLIVEKKLPVGEFGYEIRPDADWQCFLLSSEEFHELYPVYSDETPEEYFQRTIVESTDPETIYMSILAFQPLSILSQLAQSVPPRRLYFETKGNLLDYLREETNRLPLLESLVRIHNQAYPGREKLVQAHLSRYRHFPGRILPGNELIILACPPLWFEEIGLQTLARRPVSPLRIRIRALLETFPVLEEALLPSSFQKRVKLLTILAHVDPQKRVTRDQLFQICRTYRKELLTLSPKALFEVLGFRIGYRTLETQALTSFIMKMQDHPGFYTFETSNDLRITYGSFTNFIWYTIDELELIFQSPNNPFPIRDIYLLSFRLEKYKKRARNLLEIIQRILAHT